MTKYYNRVGIMWDLVRDDATGEDRFPTVAEVNREHYSYGNTYASDWESPPFADWFAVAVDPTAYRYADDDREAMDETNWDALCESIAAAAELGDDAECGGKIPRVYSITIQTGTRWVLEGDEDAARVGVCVLGDGTGRLLAIAPPSTYAPHDCDDWRDGECSRCTDEDPRAAVVDAAREALSALADYPLLNDSAYSEREYAAWIEYAPTAFRDELRDAVRNGAMDGEYAERVEEHAEDILPIVGQYLDYSYGFSGDYAPNFLTILTELVALPAPPAAGQDTLPMDGVPAVDTWEMTQRADGARLRALLGE